MEIEDLLATYPRQRPPLTESHKQIYRDEYKLNRTGKTFWSGVSQRTEGWLHRQVASFGRMGSVLEIGAGTLNHLPYESYEKVVGYDIVEPFEELYSGSAHLARIRNIYQEITQVQTDEFYDRIISVAVLEHLTNLPFVVVCSALHLKEGGLFQHGIPSEGGFAWGLAWRLTTGLSFRLRTGLSYKTLMRHEHVNTALEVVAIVRYFFGSIVIRRFPFAAHHLSFYTYIHASMPNRQRCDAFLAKLGAENK